MTFLAFLSAAVAMAWGFRRLRAHFEFTEWKAMAGSMGLRFKSSWRGTTFMGWHQGMQVEATQTKDAGEFTTKVRVTCAAQVNPQLTLKSEGSFELRPESTTTGDVEFDDAVFLHGPERYWRAILDEHTRATLREVVGDGIEFSQGVATFQMHGVVTEAELVERLTQVQRATQVLALDLKDIPKRLAYIARNDANSAVRYDALRQLETEYSVHDVCRETLEAALEDPALDIRIFAATHLNDARSVAVLMKIALQVESGTACRSAALQALVKRREAAGVSPFVEAALASYDEELRVAGVNALTLVQGAKASEALVRLLLNDPSPKVQVACAEDLGEVGDKHAVLPLQQLAEETSSKLIKLVAAQSVRQIQYQLGRVGEGQVSVVDAPGAVGAVSEVGADAGAVSQVPNARIKEG